MPKRKIFAKNNGWLVVCIIVLVGLFPGPTLSQYDNVDYELDYEEEPSIEEQPQQGSLLPGPDATLFPPPPAAPGTTSTGGVEDKPTIFKLPENYSVHKSPPLLDGQPIPVDFSMLVFNIFDIREIQEEISLEVNYKMYWTDKRLSNWTKNIDPDQKFATISTTLLHRIWHPDIFIDHIKRVTQPQLISPASSLRIYKDGSLRYTSRTLLVLTCRMDFHFYPADTQECNVTMKSFAYSTKQIDIGWRDGIGALLAKSIDVHNFDVALRTHEDYLQMTKSNNFSALVFGIQLRRKLSYHVIQTYVPSTLFTVVSWLSFLVPPDSTPGRMAICVTTLLTVTAMFGSVKQNTPNVAYIKALDLWMFFCIVFIFISLAEFTLILKLRSMKQKKRPQKKVLPPLIDPEKAGNKVNHVGGGGTNNSSSAQNHVNSGNSGAITGLAEMNAVVAVIAPPPKPVVTGPTKYFVWSQKIEKYAPRVVPLIFIGFTCFYWPYLLIASDYYGLSTDPNMYYTV